MAKLADVYANDPWTTEPSSSHHLHKSLTIRSGDKGNSSSLRSLYRNPQSIDLSPDTTPTSQKISNGVPTTPKLPPTPPAATNENTTPATDDEFSDAALFRSTLVTPINQNSPPTPDNTPPRQGRYPLLRPFLGTQPSLASTRAESFKTAREELTSENESETNDHSFEGPTPKLRQSPARFLYSARRTPPKGLSRSPLFTNENLPHAIDQRQIKHEELQTPVKLSPREQEQSQIDHDAVAPFGSNRWSMQDPLEMQDAPDTLISVETEDDHRRSIHRLATVSPGLRIDTDTDTYNNSKADGLPLTNGIGLRRGTSLRDRLKAARKDSFSASTEKFASIIGWNNSVPTTPGVERQFDINLGSTIGAVVVDSSPFPRRQSTLRHVRKNNSLRSASSPLPDITKRLSVHSNGDSPRRLLHKKGRLSNQDRWSFGSEVSRTQSLSYSATPFKVEIIKVAVIPERTSSLQSSNNSNKSPSTVATSSKTHSRKASDSLPPSSWHHKRSVSESLQQERGRNEKKELVVPPRASSLSAPTSRNTSRAPSVTSEHLREKRQEAEVDLRKTLERMESDRLLATLRSTRGQQNIPSKSGSVPHQDQQAMSLASNHIGMTPVTPRQSLGDGSERRPSVVMPGSKEWAALRPSSTLETPFSQPSFLSGSPELNEAQAINYFPHNNHSLQVIEPNIMQESRAVREVRKHQIRGDENNQSPLRYPRKPPQTPQVHVIPPTPIEGPSRVTSQRTRFGSQRRPAHAEQTDSFIKSLTRNLSLRNAKNNKASQTTEKQPNPFWQPQPFWEHIDGTKNVPVLAKNRDSFESGVVNNSLGLPQETNVITGPMSLVRRISERRRRDRTLSKQSSRGSLSKIRMSRKYYKSPSLRWNLHFMGIRDIQDRLLFAKQRKEDEKRARRRALLRESIGANVIPQGDSRFPKNDSSLVRA